MALYLQLIDTFYSLFLTKQLYYICFSSVSFLFLQLHAFSDCSGLHGVNPIFFKKIRSLRLLVEGPVIIRIGWMIFLLPVIDASFLAQLDSETFFL